MNEITEKDLDHALEEALKNSPEFGSWFLSQTKFAGEKAAYYWSRSDHPWGKVPSTVRNSETGVEEKIVRESETDVLVVFKSEEDKRFALHIENKKRGGKFEYLQPELYGQRAKQWLGYPKYCEYTDFQTVLVAPREFYERWTEDAKKFDCYISHEEISNHIPIFRT